MIWTPTELERLKALRDKSCDTPAALNMQVYEHALSEADPLARIEELERRWEALKTWLPTRRNAPDWTTIGMIEQKMRELEASHE